MRTGMNQMEASTGVSEFSVCRQLDLFRQTIHIWSQRTPGRTGHGVYWLLSLPLQFWQADSCLFKCRYSH